MRCQPQYEWPVYIWLKNTQQCLLCNDPADTPQPICQPCETELPWLVEHCTVCALPLAVSGQVCSQCLSAPPAFAQVIAPWSYSFPVDSLITRFKHSANWPYGRLLGELLGQFVQHCFDEGLPRPAALVPVPLARQRLRARGFNQAAMLAKWLSASLQIPSEEHLLQRIHDTTAQQDLSARARQQNLRNAFALTPQAAIKGRHLALVDDVLTTGATAQSLARTAKPGAPT